MSGIIPPGPELQPKVQLIAAKLSKLAKNQADDFVKKLLNSPRASEVFFADPKDMFYPYYLEQLNLYRNNTAMADAMIAAAQKEKDAAATKASATSASHDVSATTSVSVSLSASGTVVRNGGNVNEEVLRNIEQDAKMCAEDPHPDVFTINRDRHAVEILPKHLSFMSVTAQYAAKYGPSFMEAVRRKHGEDESFRFFRFLRMDDPRFLIFKELEVAYQTILCSTDVEAEDRLELYQGNSTFFKLCEDKSRFLRAEIARKKAALLTDDELRRRLEWDAFSVVQTFSAKDLGLEAKAAAAAAAPAAPVAVDTGRYLAPPTAATQTFMNAALLKPSDSAPTSHLQEGNRYPQPPSRYPQPPSAPSPAPSGGPRFLQPPTAVAPVVEEGYQLRTAVPTSSGAMEYFLDPTTGQRVHVSELKDHASASIREGREGEGKRPREEGAMLAHDDEYERNILRRVGQ
ncbi:Hypothetical protein, putative [Bodo saltans]|uniref:SURP motif domain-containing protein n=1 Tax=Bodo saltans TaxID=75058 RepID=A0A0S4IPX0_BODSA|nr:Hypothetical protein, putative [Bodo saltans]|eukprot:CUF14266.1 Hypothetical protein, putative [Bodo saltans]